MNLQTVPEWGSGNGRDSLDVIWGAPEPFSPSKVRWEGGHATRRFDPASVPDHDFEELCWEDGQLLVVMQVLGTGTNKPNLRVQSGTDQFVPVDEIASVQSGLDDPFITSPNNEASIYTLSANPNPQEDELLAWLQYPFDEPEILTTDSAHVPPSERLPLSGSVNLMNPEEAHVAGLASSSTVRWNSTFLSMPPPSVTSCMQKNAMCSSSHGDNGYADDVGLAREFSLKPSKEAINESQTLGTRSDISATSNRTTNNASNTLGSSMNFSSFARPAATFKANLQSIGIASGPTGAERLKHLDRMSTLDALKPESIDSAKKGICEPQIVPSPMDDASASIVHDHSSGYLSTWNESKDCASFHERLNGSSDLIDRSNDWKSSIINDVGITGVVEALEPSDTSSCDGSEKFDPDDKAASNIRMAYDGNSSIPSKALENETTISVKKQGGAAAAGEGNINKKRRIAESHNQSERRRRDRISEKMKALQSLVPNSQNKSDKASMLEAAITYIKALKAQIKMMSCISSNSNAYFLSPMLLQGMQPVTMAAWPAASMAMGMAGGNSAPTVTTNTTGRQYPPLRPTPSIERAMETPNISTATISSAKFDVTAHGTLKPAVVSPVYRMIVPATTHGSMVTCNPLPMQSLVGFPSIQQLQQPIQVSATGAYDSGHRPTTFMACSGLMQQ